MSWPELSTSPTRNADQIISTAVFYKITWTTVESKLKINAIGLDVMGFRSCTLLGLDQIYVRLVTFNGTFQFLSFSFSAFLSQFSPMAENYAPACYLGWLLFVLC